MTEQLVHDPAVVAALSAQVAARTGFPLSHIEKDFWVTEVLRGVVGAANGVEIVFKGGTSLSEAFSLIERFSEDVAPRFSYLSPKEQLRVQGRLLWLHHLQAT